MESGDKKNIIAAHNAVKKTGKDYFNYSYDGETLMHILFATINDDNYEKIFDCVKYFIVHWKKINLEKEDNNGKNPMIILMSNCNLIKYQSEVISFVLQIRKDFNYPKTFEIFNLENKEKNLPIVDSVSEIEATYNAGMHHNLCKLLQNTDLTANEEPHIAKLVKHFAPNTTKLENHYLCLDILLSNEHILKNINLRDEEGHTALCYAIKYNKTRIIQKLLEKSANIGVNCIDIFAIKNINTLILEEHLDSCITSNDVNSNDYEIKYNYTSILPIKSKNEDDLDNYSQMKLFEYFSKSADLEYLLNHPVISSFLYLKWRPMKTYFNITAGMSTLYFLISIYYFTFTTITTPTSPVLFSSSFILYMIVFLNSALNFPKLNLIPLIILFPRYSCITIEYKYYCFYIILAAFELFYCLKGLSFLSISKHFYLFLGVLRNYIKLFIFYLYCIFIFALVFLKIYRDHLSLIHDDVHNMPHSYDFYSPSMSILHTLVMSISDYDADSMSELFVRTRVLIYVFIFFMIVTTIILSNLLIGLAKDDTVVCFLF